jgi:hypothetical protein
VVVSPVNNTDAGTASASVSYGGDANHTDSSASASFAIGKAGTSTSITCTLPVTYTGGTITPCSATVGGVGINQAVPVTYDNNTNAGTASASAVYAGDGNHDGSDASTTFTIAKAPTATTVTCISTVTYTGSPLTPCSASVSGANLIANLSINYSSNTNAGTASASAEYLGDANHLGSNDTKPFAIAKATSSVTLECPTSEQYTGEALEPCSASATGAALNEELLVTYTGNLNVGTASASATYSGDANHTGNTGSASFLITKAPSVTKVLCPTNVTYNAVAQTPCTSSVTGAGGLAGSPTITYANNTNAGTATATATFAGDDNHTGSTDSSGFTIGRAGSVVTVTCPANLTYTGGALSPCTAVATGVGSLNQALTVTHSINTNAGTASANASFAGDDNHTGSTGSATFIIDKAPTTTAVTCPVSSVYTGLAIELCTASVTGAGGLLQSLAVSYSANTNVGTATANASYDGDTNHTSSIGTKTFAITKASSTTTLTCPANVVYTAAALTPCSALATGVGGLTTPVTVNYANNVTVGTATASAAYGGDANHNPSSDSKQFTIVPRDALVAYIGQLTFMTSGSSSTTAQVTLSASVQDPTGSALVGATAEFIDANTGKVLASGVKVTTVAGSPANTATANTVVTLSTGQYGSQEYPILVKLTGNYTNSAQSATDKTATVVVSRPAATTEIIGGGTITNLSTKAGTYGATASGTPTTFSVGLKYNKSGTNPQGKINVAIEQTDGSIIYIRSNSITSITTTAVTGGRKATVYTKSSVARIDSAGVITTLDGGVTLRMDAVDLSGTANDTIGFTVLSTKDSTLYYSNNWVLTTAWATVAQAVGGGTIMIA